jgi:peptidoglycan/xylan/chitin deacetylase (PgdA/CDA1 family)
MPRQVVPPPAAQAVPDYLNWSWHEYEMRVAFWRVKTMFDRHAITPSISINSAVCTTYPEVADACRHARWEFVAHGVTQRPVNEITDEPAMIRQCLDEIEAFTGRRPRGWASPGLAQTKDTVDHLTAEGIEYACDWVLDDQPFDIETKNGTLVGLPYTVDLNDVPAIAVLRQPIQQYKQSICDAFDRLYMDAHSGLRVLTIVLHPYICGASHRMRYIEEAFAYMFRPDVGFWSGEQILDWYRRQGDRSA